MSGGIRSSTGRPDAKVDAAGTKDGAIPAQAERALRDQQQLLASLLDNLPLGVGIYDHKGDLIHSNVLMRDYVGVRQLPSREPGTSVRWQGFDPEGRPIALRTIQVPGRYAVRP